MSTHIIATGIALGTLSPIPSEYYQRIVLKDGFISASISTRKTATDLAARASCKALKSSNISPNQLGAIFYISILDQGSWCHEPAYDLARRIHADNVPAFNMRQSCNGGLFALELAKDFSKNIQKPVLISISDCFHKSNLVRWDGDNSIFGDGAVSILIDNSIGVFKTVAISSRCDNAQEAETRGKMEYEVGDMIDFDARRLEFYEQNGGMVSSLLNIEEVVKNAIFSALEKANISISDISWILTANINESIITQQLDRFFHFPIIKSGWKFGCRIGHLGAADQLVSLHLLEERKMIKSGQYIMLFGGGTGYNITVVILKKN